MFADQEEDSTLVDREGGRGGPSRESEFYSENCGEWRVEKL